MAPVAMEYRALGSDALVVHESVNGSYISTRAVSTSNCPIPPTTYRRPSITAAPMALRSPPGIGAFAVHVLVPGSNASIEAVLKPQPVAPPTT